MALIFPKDFVSRPTDEIKYIILHHRCGYGDINSIHQSHIKRGFNGVGYHYYIRRDGTEEVGRPVDAVGAHCKGNNRCSVGICLEGDFRKDKITKEQIETLRKRVTSLVDNFPIRKIFNHKDLCKTLCPVIDLKELVKDILEERR